ncbi:MAG: glycosyltransferase, partial [Gemmatimonadota bacterium]
SAPWKNALTVWSLVSGWRRIRTIARDQRTRLAVATGGYAAGATIVWAAASRTPLVLQEANSFAGQTTRLGSRYAREIYLGFPEAVHSFPLGARSRCVDTGNPIERPPARESRMPREAARSKWGFPATGAPVVLVFGGSQGSVALNDLVAGWLTSANGDPARPYVIWATGKDLYPRYAQHASKYVAVVPYLSPISDAYAATDVALTRAGAMTTAELCAWAIPAVLVPLPTAAADHQTANAKALEAAGAALRVDQKSTTAQALGDTVMSLVCDETLRLSVARHALERARPDAADTIARRILTILTSSNLSR